MLSIVQVKTIKPKHIKLINISYLFISLSIWACDSVVRMFMFFFFCKRSEFSSHHSLSGEFLIISAGEMIQLYGIVGKCPKSILHMDPNIESIIDLTKLFGHDTKFRKFNRSKIWKYFI